MNRRDVVLALLALGAGLRVAEAQQSKAVPTIGVLRTPPPTDHLFQALLAGLRELGYVEGKTVLIEYRQGGDERLPELAQDLVRSKVDLIFAPNPVAAQAARKATATIPIVVGPVSVPSAVR